MVLGGLSTAGADARFVTSAKTRATIAAVASGAHKAHRRGGLGRNGLREGSPGASAVAIDSFDRRLQSAARSMQADEEGGLGAAEYLGRFCGGQAMPGGQGQDLFVGFGQADQGAEYGDSLGGVFTHVGAR